MISLHLLINSLILIILILLSLLWVVFREYQVCELRRDILLKIRKEINVLDTRDYTLEDKLQRVNRLQKRYEAMPSDRNMVFTFKKIKSFDIDWS